MALDYDALTNGVSQARSQGLSDDEIFNHLASKNQGFKEAFDAGYKLDDVLTHLQSKQSKGGEPNEDQIRNQPQADQEGNAQRVPDQQEPPLGSQANVQANVQLRTQDQGQRERNDQARLTNEGQTENAQGGIQGTKEGEVLGSQVPARNKEEVTKGSVPPAPKGFVDQAKEAAVSAYKGLGSFASEAQQYAFDLAKQPLLANAATAEEVFGPNAFSDKIRKGVVEKGDQYFRDLVAGSKMTGEEAKSPLNQFMFGVGHMVGDLIPAVATAGMSAEEQAISKAADLPIWKTIGQKAINGMKDFSVPALISANTKIDEEKQAGKTDEEALASGMKSLIETEAGAAIPMQVSSGLDNIILRGASRILQSTPLAVAQSELAKVAGNVVSKESERTPTITENIISGNFDQAARELAQVAPMGLLGVMGERAKPIKDAGLPATAAVIESEPIKPRLETEAIADIKPPVALGKEPSLPKEETQPPVSVAGESPAVEPVSKQNITQEASDLLNKLDQSGATLPSINNNVNRILRENGIEVTDKTTPEEAINALREKSKQPAEAPAEAQPTKPSETKVKETSGIPTLESVAPVAETAVKAEEGVAQREGEGKEEVAVPEGARVAAAAYLADDGQVYEGSSHLNAMKAARETPRATQEETKAWKEKMDAEIASKQAPKSRNTEEFGYAVTLPDGTRTTTTREFGGKIAKESGQAKVKEYQFGEKAHSNEMTKDDYPETGAKVVTPSAEMPEVPSFETGKTVMRGMAERMVENEQRKAGEETDLSYRIQADELVKRKELSTNEANEFVYSLGEDKVLSEYERVSSLPKSESNIIYQFALGSRASEILKSRGQSEAAAEIINKLTKEGSYGGVLLNAVGRFFPTTAKGYVDDIVELAKTRGVDLSKQARDKVESLYQVKLDTKKAFDDSNLDMFKATDKQSFDAAIKKMKDTGDKAMKAQQDLIGFVERIMPKDLQEDMYPALQKLGLITPRSALVNLAQNIMQGFFVYLPKNIITASADNFRSMLTGKERQFIFGPKEAILYVKTLGKYMPEMAKNILMDFSGKGARIQDPTSAYEIKTAFNPINALRRLSGKEENLEYSYTFKEKAKDVLEFAYGGLANRLGNLLVFTDRPSRLAVQASTASSIARQLGLKGADYEKFMVSPEKGIEFFVRKSTKDPAERASKIKELKERYDTETKEALFEKEGKAYKTLSSLQRLANNLISDSQKRGVPGWAATVFSNAIIPFVRFTANYASAVFKMTNPIVPAISMISNAASKKYNKAANDLAILGISTTMAAIGAQLYKNGVITPSIKPQEKEGDAAKTTNARGGLFNFSAFNRFLKGESTEWNDNDYVVSLASFGLPGIMLNAEADIQKKLYESRLSGEKQTILGKEIPDQISARLSSLPMSIQYTLNAMAVKGLSDFSQAAIDGKWDKWMKSFFKTVSAVPMPAIIEQSSRAIRDNQIETNDSDLIDAMKKIAITRAGFGSYLEKGTPQVGIWGEPVLITPKGMNPIVHNLFNPILSSRLNINNASKEMYRLYKQTADKGVFPSDLDQIISIPQGRNESIKLKLNDEQFAEYKKTVGQQRLSAVSNLMDKQFNVSGSKVPYSSLSPASRSGFFKKALEAGTESGKILFLKTNIEKGLPIGTKQQSKKEREAIAEQLSVTQ